MAQSCTARSSGSMTIPRHCSWVRPPERARRVAAATSDGRVLVGVSDMATYTLRPAETSWARTISNRRPLVCKATGTCEPVPGGVGYVQLSSGSRVHPVRCVQPVRPCLGTLANAPLTRDRRPKRHAGTCRLPARQSFHGLFYPRRPDHSGNPVGRPAREVPPLPPRRRQGASAAVPDHARDTASGRRSGPAHARPAARRL
jgi:hypothetical protein